MNCLPCHGVLISFNGTGCFLIGESGVGKSETALQLIHQGAMLVCDDAPEFIIDKETKVIIGRCPKGFDGLMHLRDLGVINVINILGKNFFKKQQSIDFVVELSTINLLKTSDVCLTPDYQQWFYCVTHEQNQSDVRGIPGVTLHLTHNRNIPLLVQTAITQFSNNKQVKINETTDS